MYDFAQILILTINYGYLKLPFSSSSDQIKRKPYVDTLLLRSGYDALRTIGIDNLFLMVSNGPRSNEDTRPFESQNSI